MKGIIVVDMPECCKYCPFVTSRVNGNYYCSIIESIGDSLGLSNPISDDEFYSKPNWRPIREVPVTLEEIKSPHSMGDFQRKGFSRGWNSCIDAITEKK